MITISTDMRWFAVVAKPGKQQVAEANLRRQGYGTFLPLCRSERKNGSHGVEIVTRPLFDRYLFVGVGTEQRFDALWSTIGVAFVVTDRSGLACRVPVVVLREIARRLDADGVLDLVPPEADRPRWEPGLSLRVLEGPFREFTAIFQRPGNDGTVAQVLIDLFGRSMTLSVAFTSLEPVGEGIAEPRRAGPGVVGTGVAVPNVALSVPDAARAAVDRLRSDRSAPGRATKEAAER